MCVSVCRNFANGGELEIFKKGGGSCTQRQGEHWNTTFKISLVILKGRGKIDWCMHIYDSCLSLSLLGSGLGAAAIGIGYFARVHHLAYFLVFQILSGFMQVK